MIIGTSYIVNFKGCIDEVDNDTVIFASTPASSGKSRN
jgi:hypothetical protein